ncbi:MAG TPA: PASTA domain-containing protein [Acidimicrobiia bacterium]|nr:PASTA domain-containing protein [Acidimicrobiia bacterium]
MAHSTLIDLVGRVLAGRYRLLAPIGSGSSGRVYLADDVRLRRRVAVKVLHGGLADDAGFLRRFRAEAQMAASLHHPHVMAVYDWGEDDGVPFMVLELLKGGSLRSLLDEGPRLSPAQAAHVGRQVAAALAYAHARGLVHRDVKPANLLFDEHGIVRVGDFGLARALAEASWTEPAGTVVGTARYSAPEQAGGGPLDARADLYSLAVVLVEACTGEVPVVGETAIGTLAARSRRGITAPEVLGPLQPVVARAGQPDPEDRYPDAAAMGADLTAAARTLPAPGALPLAGFTAAGDDVEPTRQPMSARDLATRVFDQDASTRPVPVEDEVPLVVAPPRARFRRSMVPVFVAVAVVAALVAGVAAAVAAGGVGGATIAAPSLVGLDEEVAAARATDAGVLMQVVERVTSDDPAGLVIEQRPGPGAFLAEGDDLDVVVSRGPPPVDVPVIAGLPLAEAQAQLEAVGFVVNVVRQHDENVAVDIALGTDPPSPGQAPRESVISLIVSDGPAPVEVPAVAGQGYDTAAANLAEKRFAPVRRDEFSDDVEVGIVIGTDPAAGTLAPRDSEVVVRVSKGPELIAVPPLVGLTVEAASQALADAGLSADVQNFAPGKKVRAQDPSPGTKVKRGAKVTLFL